VTAYPSRAALLNPRSPGRGPTAASHPAQAAKYLYTTEAAKIDKRDDELQFSQTAAWKRRQDGN